MQPERERPRALLIDWGGVLTTNLFASFHAYCVRAGIDPRKLRRALQRRPRGARAADRAGDGRARRGGLRAALRRAARRRARRADRRPVRGRAARRGDGRGRAPRARGRHPHRARVELLGRAPLSPRRCFGELFDGVVISGEEGIRKPSRRMYELGAERAGAPAHAVRLRRRPALQPDAGAGARDGHRPPHRRRDHDRRARAPASACRCASRRRRRKGIRRRRPAATALSRACRARTAA